MPPKDRYNVTDIAAPYDVSCNIKAIMLPMRDGVRLHTLIYFPPDMPEKAPAIIVRSPYTRKVFFELPNALALKHRMVYVLQACRGTGWSEGVFDPAERDNEMNDAADLIDFLAGEAWFNGRCAMSGGSYPGWTQWSAMRSGRPELVGVMPRVAPLFGCTGAARTGGVSSLAFALHWMLSMHHRSKYGYEAVPDYEKMNLVEQLPVVNSDLHAGYPELPPLRKFLAKAKNPAHYLAEHRNEFASFKVPALISGGWFDIFKTETVTSFMLMRSEAASPAAREHTRLVIGPWGHGGLINPELFGEENGCEELFKLQDRFIINLLNAPDADPLPGEPAVCYFMLGENRWYRSDSWPPRGVRELKAFLHSGGRANTVNGDGRIDFTAPAVDEPADCYISDPADPVRSAYDAQGCYVRNEAEARSDVLVYSSAKFTAPLTVTGEVKVKFYASASTPDTDFFATLTMVMPDGRSLLLSTGGVRARFRNGGEPELLEPGKLYLFEINLSHIAVKFMPGMSMRLDICGQEFPTFDRNANSGKELFSDTELFAGKCLIRHDAAYPAEIIMQIVGS